jgi:hypothetical protein
MSWESIVVVVILILCMGVMCGGMMFRRGGAKRHGRQDEHEGPDATRPAPPDSKQ